MAKDAIKEGLVFALGVVKISGEQFNKVIRQLEKKNKVSSVEGKKMVYRWINDQQKQLERMRRNLKKESVKTKLYNSRDLIKMNSLIRRLSREILSLNKKKKKAEASASKKKKKALKKRTAKGKTAKKRTAKKKAKGKPAKKKKKKRR